MIRIVLLSENGTEAVEVGRIEFETLLVQRETDYCCNPQGLLTHEQIDEICRELRHLPQVNMGHVGRFRWIVRD